MRLEMRERADGSGYVGDAEEMVESKTGWASIRGSAGSAGVWGGFFDAWVEFDVSSPLYT